MRQVIMNVRPSLRCPAILVLGAGLLFSSIALVGCDQMPPVDVNFDSSVGADFTPPLPPADAAPEAIPDAGAADAP
jgi:hypothetical protein